jgi:hypothetical protein
MNKTDLKQASLIKAAVDFIEFRAKTSNPSQRSWKRSTITAAVDGFMGYRELTFFTNDMMEEVAKLVGGKYIQLKKGTYKIRLDN